MEVINMHDAKSNLSKLVERVIAGDTVYISRRGKVVAQLTSVTKPTKKRTGGVWKGKVKISEDFDALPDEVIEGFMGAEE